MPDNPTPALGVTISSPVHAVQRTSPSETPNLECQAAIVTTVLGDPNSSRNLLVNLAVFGDSPAGTGVTFVHAARYEEPNAGCAEGGTWHWSH